MVALLRLLHHCEVGFHLGLVLESSAVDALELRVALVILVIGAGDAGEFEGANVASAHHMRPGAQVNELAVFVIGNCLAFGNVFQISQFELAGSRPFAEPAQSPALGVFHGLLAADDDPLERVVRLDLFFHLLLDFREIFR